VDVLETGLQARGVLFGLLDKSELVGKGVEAGIRLQAGRIECRGAGGNQGGIDRVVLGTAQVQPGISFGL
jgi:hypothetical protein